MLITRGTTNRTRNLELGGGLERSDGGVLVIGNEEVEEHVSAKRGRHCVRSTARTSKLIVKNGKKKSQQVHVVYPEQIWFNRFSILEAPAMSNTP